MSLLIAELEGHPHQTYLNPDSPLVQLISCAADSSPDIPHDLKRAIHKVEDSLSVQGCKGKKGKGKIDAKALKQVEDWWVEGSYKDGTLPRGMGKAMVSTTQATDIIDGGVKVNALVCRLTLWCSVSNPLMLSLSPRWSLRLSTTESASLHRPTSSKLDS